MRAQVAAASDWLSGSARAFQGNILDFYRECERRGGLVATHIWRYPVYVVTHGMNGMPPVGQMMTDQQVADVVNYVRTNFGNRYRDKVKPEDVKTAR